MKKLTLEELITAADNAKKVNPLDLSADQDLTIGLMNLISLEEHFFFSGAKTGKTSFYDLINPVREMRKTLMERVVKKSSADSGDEVWCISKHLLAASMRLMEVGTKQLGRGSKEDAYDLFNKSYDLYSLFWGLNMDLIDTAGVKKIEKDMGIQAANASESETEKKTESETEKTESSVVKRLGRWVKNAVNCCIE